MVYVPAGSVSLLHSLKIFCAYEIKLKSSSWLTRPAAEPLVMEPKSKKSSKSARSPDGTARKRAISAARPGRRAYHDADE
jgi:hypothetical protein